MKDAWDGRTGGRTEKCSSDQEYIMNKGLVAGMNMEYFGHIEDQISQNGAEVLKTNQTRVMEVRPKYGELCVLF